MVILQNVWYNRTNKFKIDSALGGGLISYTGRKIEIITLDAARYLVTTTTSSFGVGINEGDNTIVFPYLLGRLKTRSLVGELMSINATLSVMSIIMFVEMIPYGEEIIRGIKDELSTAYDGEIPLLIHNESDEDNDKTILSMVASGVVYKEQIKVDSTLAKDFIYALGIPNSPDDITDLDSQELAKLYCIGELAMMPAIHEIFICNGQSLVQSIEYIERTIGLTFGYECQDEILLNKIGYGASCLLFSSKSRVKSQDFNGIPITYLGRMR